MLKASVVLLLLAGPGLADCVTADDLAQGITFARQDGRTGLVTTNGKGISINYAATSPVWTDRRDTRFGVYETAGTFFFNEDIVIGIGGDARYTWTFSARPPMPQPELAPFVTTIAQVRKFEDGTSAGTQIERETLNVTYTFDSPRIVSLSGCPFTVFAVEATIQAPDIHLTRRWAYFADLGFGLETQVTDHLTEEVRTMGITAITAPP